MKRRVLNKWKNACRKRFVGKAHVNRYFAYCYNRYNADKSTLHRHAPEENDHLADMEDFLNEPCPVSRPDRVPAT